MARCVDGQWERPSDSSFACGLPCDPHFGKPFAISVVEGSRVDEGYYEGSRLRVTCAVGARVTAGSDPAVWMCQDGSWSGDSIVCDYCCGPYSPPDSAYSVVSGEGDCLGASRSIECSEDSDKLSGDEPAVAACGMAGWSTLDLQCKRRCYGLPTATANAEFVQRDAWTYDLECMEGYVSREGSKAVLLCESGVFRLEGNIECVVGCSPLDLGQAYDIVAQQHEATVSCSSEAVLLTPAVSSDVVFCQDGLWSSSRTRCEIPCQPLEEEFPEMHFSFATEGSRVECAPGYMPVVDVERPIVSDYVLCVDGKWRALDGGLPLHSGPRVVCHLPCDQLSLSERFRVEGTGRRHGSTRTVSCAPGHDSADSLTTLTCVDGTWKGESLSCGRSCPAESFVEFDAPRTHGSEVTYSCSPEHHLWGPEKSAKTCVDGEWTSSDTICGVLVCRGDICFAGCPCAEADSCSNGVRDGNEEGIDCGGRCADCENCDVGALDVFDGRNVHVPQLTSFLDGTAVPLQCELLAQADPAIGFVKCHHGILIGDVSFSCARPTCFDGVHNGREEGVDCGGDCLSSCPRLGDGVWNGDERGPDCNGDCRYCYWPTLIGNPDEGSVDLLLSGEWKTDLLSMSAIALQEYLDSAPFSDLMLDQSVSGASPLTHLQPFGVKCGNVNAAGFCFDGEFAFLASSPGLNAIRTCLGRSSWRAFRMSFFSSPTVTLTHMSVAFGQTSLPCSSTLRNLGSLLEGSCSRLAYDDRSEFFCSQCRDSIDTILATTWTGCEQLQADIRVWLRLLCDTDDDKRCMWSHESVLNKLQALESQASLDFLAAGCGRASLQYFHSSEELYHTLAVASAPQGNSGFLWPRKDVLRSPLQDTKPFIEVLRFDPALASLQGTCWPSMALLLESESLSECYDKCLEEWASLGAGLATLAQSASFLGPNRLRIALFGDLILWMARSGCRRGYSGERCGQGLLETAYAPSATVNVLPSAGGACQCPIERLGNGWCDEQCLSVECAYDGGDCFIERHQAPILGWLNQLLPFSECHPLAAAGACRGDCRDQMTRFVQNHDCCAGAYIELLAVLLRTQA
ncbi:MAG: uncharacterized protein KVP18_002666 [Porospora cf. gigantea A]|nr:MAG: hypothetical protein KVP18_002666 [Porospora cf. gigantea A]